MYYRITTYDQSGQKEIVLEDQDDDNIMDMAETCLQDLFDGHIKSLVVSRITGRPGMRDDL